MLNSKSNPLLMVVTVVAARTNRVSAALPVIVLDDLNGYLLSGDGRSPRCYCCVLAALNRSQNRFAPNKWKHYQE